MIHQIALILVLGLPLNFYLGILTFLSFLFTASIGFSNYHGYKWIPFKWHPVMVVVSFTIAIIHVIFSMSLYFGY